MPLLPISLTGFWNPLTLNLKLFFHFHPAGTAIIPRWSPAMALLLLLMRLLPFSPSREQAYSAPWPLKTVDWGLLYTWKLRGFFKIFSWQQPVSGLTIVEICQSWGANDIDALLVIFIVAQTHTLPDILEHRTSSLLKRIDDEETWHFERGNKSMRNLCL